MNMISGAQWVWDTTAFDNGGTARVGRTFTIPVGATDIEGIVHSGFDDGGTVVVNGVDLGSGGVWYAAATHDVSSYLHSGENTVTLNGQNGFCESCTNTQGNPGGIVGKITASWSTGGATPTPEPTPTPTSALSIADGVKAFSPNGDGTKDTVTLVVNAGDKQSWSINAEGGGLIAQGVGSQSIPWSGTYAGGSALAEGRQTLILAADGNEPQSVSIVIDNQAPVVTGAELKKIEFVGAGQPLVYRFSVDAKERLEGRETSGYDLQATKVTQTSVTSHSTEEAVELDDKVEVKVNVAREAAQALTYTIQVIDKAGNKATYQGKFEVANIIGGEVTERVANCATGSAYELLAKRGKKGGGFDEESADALADFLVQTCARPISAGPNPNFFFPNRGETA